MNKMNFSKSKRLFKRIMSVLTAFLILAGSGIIVNMLIIAGKWEEMSEMGFVSQSAMSLPVYFLVLATIAFLIYELNKNLQNSAVAIGLVLALMMSLPELINSVYYVIPLSVTVWTIANNFFSITLASYVFYMMWN